MKPNAAGLDSRELNKRIADADKAISAKQEALDAKIEQLQADGKSLHDLPADEMAALTAERLEIDALKEDRKSASDFARTWAGQHAAATPAADRAAAGLHALVTGGLTEGQIMGGGFTTPGVEVLDRDSLVSAMRGGGHSWFAAATADLDAGIPEDQRLYPPVEIRRREVRLLDLITVGATDSDTVKYARQTTRTAAAAETALGTAYSEASFDFDPITAAVFSIGHFTTAYRENIADAAQFATLVEGQLQEDVVLRAESQVLVGAGTTEIEGILAASLSGSIGTVTRNLTSERRIAALHRAITTIRVNAFREPDAILMHPNDYQDMVLEEINLTSTTGSAIAFMPDLTGATPGFAWGKQIVVSPVATEGTALVGYWKDATLWMREGVSLRVSDSHSDYFTKRQVAIVADMRAAFSVQRPASFCKVIQV